jgi:plastocyanin
VIALAALLAACGSDTTTGSSSPSSTGTSAPATTAAPPATAAPTTTSSLPVVPGQVVIRDYEFLPATATVAAGGTITWQNTDDVDHWVLTDDTTTVDSGHITPGQAFTATLTAPGTYAYYCDIHNSMIGTIVVE